MLITYDDINDNIKLIKSSNDLSVIRTLATEIFSNIYFILEGQSDEDKFSSVLSSFFSENLGYIKEKASPEYFEETYVKLF